MFISKYTCSESAKLTQRYEEMCRKYMMLEQENAALKAAIKDLQQKINNTKDI